MLKGGSTDLHHASVSPVDQKGKGPAVSAYVSMVFNILASFSSIFFATYCPRIFNILSLFLPLTSFAISVNYYGEKAAFRHIGGINRTRMINQIFFYQSILTHG